MTDTTHSIIIENLLSIEKEHNVCVLYAVESGSRAWGFASRDSDFDVRFLYIHSLEWYLSIRDQRDVIEVPISDNLDICGWDLRKALALFRKSNPALMEWLNSPIVYQDCFGPADRLRELQSAYFSPRRCIHHYLHMAKGNYREYLKGEIVRIKKYFYVLRPILACIWIERHATMPPTEFIRLLDEIRLSPSLADAINGLLKRKLAGDEMDREPKIEIINDFLEQQIEHFSEYVAGLEEKKVDEGLLDELFLEVLQRVAGHWNKRPASEKSNSILSF